MLGARCGMIAMPIITVVVSMVTMVKKAMVGMRIFFSAHMLLLPPVMKTIIELTLGPARKVRRSS